MLKGNKRKLFYFLLLFFRALKRERHAKVEQNEGRDNFDFSKEIEEPELESQAEDFQEIDNRMI